MGNFYTNVTLRGASRDATLTALSGRRALVTPPLGTDLVVYDEATERQDPRDLEKLTAFLARASGCLAWGVLNHDDDVLRLYLYSGERRIDSYDSFPGFGRAFGSNKPKVESVARWCETFGVAYAETRISEILLAPRGASGFRFEIERHTALQIALGWPDASVGFGYHYVSRGELPPGVLEEQLTPTYGA